MILTLDRIANGPESTLGRLSIDGEFACFTLEDQRQPGPKVAGKTRIPAGEFAIALLTEGKKHPKYLTRFGPDFHHGMLWLQDVPGFTGILIHLGNTHVDSEGCILVGLERLQTGADWQIQRSEDAYRRIYPIVAAAIEMGDSVRIQIVDRDQDAALIS